MLCPSSHRLPDNRRAKRGAPPLHSALSKEQSLSWPQESQAALNEDPQDEKRTPFPSKAVTARAMTSRLRTFEHCRASPVFAERFGNVSS